MMVMTFLHERGVNLAPDNWSEIRCKFQSWFCSFWPQPYITTSLIDYYKTLLHTQWWYNCPIAKKKMRNRLTSMVLEEPAVWYKILCDIGLALENTHVTECVPTECLFCFFAMILLPSIGITGIVTTLPILPSHTRLSRLHIGTIWNQLWKWRYGKEELVAVMFVPKVL
jgi:hypothetical protein